MKFNNLNLKILSFKKRLLTLKKTKIHKSIVLATTMIKNYFKNNLSLKRGKKLN
jgi:hypothetical protein